MTRTLFAAAFALALAAASQAHADYRLCNETSYVVNAAIGVDAGGTVATRGWFEVLPGRCRVVVEGPLDADKYFFYSKVPNYYDIAVTRFESGERLCVGSSDFLIQDARSCIDPSHRPERFIEVQPRSRGDDWELVLAEEARFTRQQAALAGAQRLLGILDYDAGRIDGVAGGQTNAALKTFADAAGMENPDAGNSGLYKALINELKARQAGFGLQVCNETRHLVWTALGIPESGKLTSRGWYRIGTGECLRPYRKALDGSAVFSFGEAVDENGSIISADNIPLIWDGDTLLCTRSTRFNIEQHENCESRGMTPTRFRKIDLGGARSWTIRYTEPR